MAVGLKYRFGYDDSLDVVGVHMVGGVIGSLLIGFFATGKGQSRPPRASSTAAASTSSGSSASVSSRSSAYSLVVSAILALLIDKTIGMRVTEDDEVAGIDQAEHAETAYDFSGAGGRRRPAPPCPAPAPDAASKKVDA